MTQAADILMRPPALLLPGDEREVKKTFAELSKKWHPDHCKDPLAGKVFDYLKHARDVRLGRTKDNRLELVRKRAGDKFALDYFREGACDAGRHYVGASTVSYLIGDDFEDLCEPAIKLKWTFPDRKVEEEMTKYLPNRVRWEYTTQGIFLAYRRNPDQMLMSDLLAWEQQRGGRVDYRHVMWFISSLLNTCCYLEISKTAHCGIVPEYLLVSPEMHSIALTGPPLYATPWGTRPKAVPAVVLEAFPRLRTKSYVVEDSKVDLTMVRALALRALGHTNAALMRQDKDLPAGLRDWLASPAPASAVADYVSWEKARGKRAFTPYDATALEMYQALR